MLKGSLQTVGLTSPLWPGLPETENVRNCFSFFFCCIVFKMLPSDVYGSCSLSQASSPRAPLRFLASGVSEGDKTDAVAVRLAPPVSTQAYYFSWVIIRKIKTTINFRTRYVIGRKENEENLRVLLETSLKVISLVLTEPLLFWGPKGKGRTWGH